MSQNIDPRSPKYFFRSRFFAVIVILVALIAAGILVYLRMFRDQAPLAEILPEQPFLYASLNSERNAEQYLFAQKYPEVVNTISTTLNTFGNVAALQLAEDFTYETDIFPWFGTEMAVAAYRRDPANPESGLHFYVIAEIGDQEQYQNFWNKLIEHDYEAQELPANVMALTKTNAATLFELNGYLVSTASVQDANFILENIQQNGPTLKNDPLYLEIRDNLPRKFDLLCLLDSITTLRQIAGDYLPEDLIESLSADPEALGLYGVALSFVSEGLKVDAFFPGLYDREPEKTGTWSFVSQVPGNAYYVIAGRNFQRLLDGLIGQPQTIERLKNIYRLQQSFGVDLEKELAPYLASEFALVNFPTTADSDNSSTVLLVRANDQEGLRETLKSISTKSFAELEINSADLQDLSEAAVSQEFFGDVPYYILWEQEFVVVALRLQDLIAYQEALVGQPLENLGNNTNYRTLKNKLGFRSSQYLAYYNPQIELTPFEVLGTYFAPGSIAGILGSANSLGLVGRQTKTGFAWKGVWLLE